MAYAAVTIQHEKQNRDMALPLQVPSRLVIAGVVQSLKLPREGEENFYLGVQTEAGMRQISPNSSLAEAGILHGAVLRLTSDRPATEAPQAGASLVSEAGRRYPLAVGTTVIGRSDPKSGIFVQVDLSSQAGDPKAISRRHAQIEGQGGAFHLADLGSTNGTKLNGERLPPQQKRPLKNGDVIEFGRNAARLTFWEG
jgi:uncharacterized ubiquitin-like protein YukD